MVFAFPGPRLAFFLFLLVPALLPAARRPRSRPLVVSPHSSLIPPCCVSCRLEVVRAVAQPTQVPLPEPTQVPLPQPTQGQPLPQPTQGQPLPQPAQGQPLPQPAQEVAQPSPEAVAQPPPQEVTQPPPQGQQVSQPFTLPQPCWLVTWPPATQPHRCFHLPVRLLSDCWRPMTCRQLSTT